MYDPANNEPVEACITRIVNMFYHCGAMCKLNHHARSNGKYYSTWEIVLYSGNNLEWLRPHEETLLTYVKNQYMIPHVNQLVIRN